MSTPAPQPDPRTPEPQLGPTAPEPQPDPGTPKPQLGPTTPEPQPDPGTPEPQLGPTTPEPQPDPRTPGPQLGPTTPEPQPDPRTAEPQPDPRAPEPQPDPRTPGPQLGPPTPEPQPDPGTAEPQLGATAPELGSSQRSSPRGWYSRGYLPHCDHPGLIQAITYRLADSLPASALAQMETELRNLPDDRRDRARRQRIEDWLDAGHGCCALQIPDAAACVVDTWQHFAGVRYDLLAWVVMPNHVHVLIQTYEGVPLGKIVQSWKSYTGRRIRAMRDRRDQANALKAGDERSRGVWMREYWDRYIRDGRHFRATVRYIHRNPVKAGLVARAEDWAGG